MFKTNSDASHFWGGVILTGISGLCCLLIMHHGWRKHYDTLHQDHAKLIERRKADLVTIDPSLIRVTIIETRKTQTPEQTEWHLAETADGQRVAFKPLVDEIVYRGQKGDSFVIAKDQLVGYSVPGAARMNFTGIVKDEATKE